MKILGCEILMASRHSLVEKYEKTEELRIWTDDEDPASGTDPQDRVKLTKNARELLEQKIKDSQPADEFDQGTNGEIMLLKALVEALSGKKINVKNITKAESNPELEEIASEHEKSHNAEEGPEREGWGIIYNSQETYQENEETSIAASGIIRTEDGKEINFTLALDMEREFKSQETFNFRAGDALIDPLVINYSGKAADLTSTKFSFDLDSDGNNDNISFVKSGSGLLALDRNGDGEINNGKELFGPTTGNGFSELAEYDKDENMWIDENDEIYSKLRIWTKDAEGNDNLNTLKEKDVGAIYLDSIDSEFSLKDNNNQLNGQVAKTGLYISEKEEVGTVQQLDIVA